MTTGPPAPCTATGCGRRQAARADREYVIETLKAAYVQGRLAKDEFDTRVGDTLAARTYAELAELTADIPAGLIAAQPRKLARGPMNNAAKVGVCAAIAAATLVVATLLAGPPGFLMFVIFYFNLLLLGAIKMLASRHQTRFRGRLLPRPGQGRQALKARPVH